MIDNSKLIHSSLWLTASQISNTIISFILSIIIIKILNVNDYAEYGIIISYSTGLSMFSFLGIPNIIQRYLPEKKMDDKYDEIISILISGFYYRSIAIIGLILISFVIILIFKISIIKNIYELAFVIFIYVSGKSFFVIVEEGLNALKEQKALFLIKSFSGIAKLVSVFIIVLYSVVDVYTLLIVFGLGDMIGGIASVSYLSKKFKVKINRVIFSLYKFDKTHIQFGFFNYLSQLQHFILSHSFEIIVISLILSKQIIAGYTFSVTISSILIGIFPISAIVKALYPLSIEKFYKTGSKTGLLNVLDELTSFIMIIYSLLTVIVILNIDWVVVLLGKKEYFNTTSIIIVLFLINLFSIIATPLKIGLIVLEDAKSIFKSNLSFVPVLILMPPATYYSGITGILVIGFLSVLSINALRYSFLKRKIKHTVITNNSLRIFFIMVIITVFALMLNYFIDDIIVKIFISLLITGILVLIYRILNLIPSMLTEFIIYFKLKITG